MMNKKGEWKMQHFLISIILTSAIFALFFFYIGGMASHYDASGIIYEEYNATFNQFDNLTGEANSGYSSIRGSGGATSLGFLSTTWTVVTTVWNSFDIFFNQVGEMGSLIGMPTVISKIIIGVILSIILIGLAYLIVNFFSPGGNKI